MKRVIFILLGLVVLYLLVGSYYAKGAGQVIYVINDSTNLSDAGVQEDLKVFQKAVDEDFGPAWNAYATLKFLPLDQIDSIQSDWWVIDVRDTPDCWGCAGYHSVRGNTPFAIVGTQMSFNWQIVFSHELFEMLADPYVNRMAVKYVCYFAGCEFKKFYFVEVGDPVPSFGYGYWKDGVRISDFALPAWFNDQGKTKLDFTGHLHHAFRVAKHGYLTTYDPSKKKLTFTLH